MLEGLSASGLLSRPQLHTLQSAPGRKPRRVGVKAQACLAWELNGASLPGYCPLNHMEKFLWKEGCDEKADSNSSLNSIVFRSPQCPTERVVKQETTSSVLIDSPAPLTKPYTLSTAALGCFHPNDPYCETWPSSKLSAHRLIKAFIHC